MSQNERGRPAGAPRSASSSPVTLTAAAERGISVVYERQAA
jgi:hypothetical protein